VDIAISVAIFTVVNALWLRPPVVAEADRLSVVCCHTEGAGRLAHLSELRFDGETGSLLDAAASPASPSNSPQTAGSRSPFASVVIVDMLSVFRNVSTRSGQV
jgi:hypothetical protein